jgi:STE24 endopeptidase
MDILGFIQILAILFIALRWLAHLVLRRLNENHALSHQDKIPVAVASVMDFETYQKSIRYTLARSKFDFWEDSYSTLVLATVLLSGWLPISFSWFNSPEGIQPVPMTLWILSVGFAFSLLSLPLDWWAQFRLEQRFGFNTSTLKLWVVDRLKGFFLGLALGFPLLWIILKWVHWMGSYWWLGAWSTLFLFQLVLVALAPILILPLFNKFTPLPEGSLRDRLLALGQRTGFNARTILVADGSRRSRHANAYFTGFGRFRKIVLYDTLIQQMNEEEIEAVLAHEIGHAQLKHIPKMLALNLALTFLGFFALGWLSAQPSFLLAFGFPAEAGVGPALLLFGLLAGTVTFWFSPVLNALSRRYEYQADRYARISVGSPTPLIQALHKLSEKNLSNLVPHPLYSAVHYSHPNLVEREAALREGAPDDPPSPAQSELSSAT